VAKRRVRRSKDQEPLYKELTNSESAKGVFDSYKDLFMLAGVVGFKYKKRKPFKETAEQIALSVFNMETDFPIITAIALLETNNFHLLVDTEENHDLKLTIFEEYAAGGLEIIYDFISKSAKKSDDNLYEFIFNSKNEMSEKEQNLKDIVDGLGGGLSW
jgi:dnd system-associated protein 4